MRGEMRRSMRGAQGHGRLTGAVIRRLTLEQERETLMRLRCRGMLRMTGLVSVTPGENM